MMVRKTCSKKEKKTGTVNFTSNYDPYAAVCMFYYENEDLCSYHKNISCQMLIQSERHIKEGHFIYR
jgi:hypothetical protein